MNTVSVIMPSYNVEKYISEALDSALAQTYKELEIIVVDDGSTDGTARIAKEYVEKDPRIKYVRRENGGCAAARNTGIRNSSGKYIAILDADDLWMDEKVRRQAEYLDNDEGVCLVFCNGFIIGRDEPLYGAENRPSPGSARYFERLVTKFKIWPTSIMFRRELLDRVGYFDESFVNIIEDVDFVTRSAYECSFGYIDERLYGRRVHADSVTTGIKADRSVYTYKYYEKCRRLYGKDCLPLVNRRFARDFYSMARKRMSQGEFREGLGAYRLSASLNGRYIPRLPGLLARYVRFRIKALSPTNKEHPK